MLTHTNGQATDQVDHQNQQTGYRVTRHKLGGTVHGAEEVRLLREFFTAFFGRLLVNHAGVQIGVNRHLFSWHRIQCETCVHFRHSASALGHHDEVDDHQNSKDDETHYIVTANHKLTEGGYHFTGSLMTFVAIDQNDAGGSHVQAQSEHGGKQQNRGE